MKGIQINLGILTAAALAAVVSCSGEKEQDAPLQGDAIRVTVHAKAPEALTKTYLDTYGGKANTVLWGADEHMLLAITSGSSTVFATSGDFDISYEDEPQAAFSFTVSPVAAASYLYQGIYPASAAVAWENTNPAAYKVCLPAVQEASSGTYDPSAFIMIARPQGFNAKETSWTASFRRTVALNKLILKGIPGGKSIRRVEITAPEDVSLSGVRRMNLSTGESSTVIDGGRNIDVNYASPVAGGSDITVWFTSWGAEIAVGQTLSIIAYTDDSCYFSKEIVIPDGHPITFLEGYLNSVQVDMSGIEPVRYYFSGGKGTADSPWQISCKEDLAELAEHVASLEEEELHFRTEYYRQTADIDYAGGTHGSIGNSNASSPYSFFNGSYDGNGFKISNVVIANPNSNKAQGFFGYLDGAAHIMNLVLENVTLASTTWNTGAIAGCVQSTSTAVIENCTVTGATLTGSDASNGGLVGKLMAGTVRGCSFQGSVTATNSAKDGCGGIVGYSSGTSCVIEDCHVLESSIISAAGQYTGGIVGKMDGGNILSCTVKGSGTRVSGGFRMVGGIVGYMTNNSNARRIEGCVVDCKEVTGTRGLVGGIIGDIECPAIINKCYVSCDVINNTDGSDGNDNGGVGGIFGQIYDNGKNMTIANCAYLGGTISNTNSIKGNVGGIVGNGNIKVMDYVVIVNCCANPTRVISGTSNQNLGGICGYISDITMRNCYSATPYTAYAFNGSVINPASNQSNGCIYGWLRGGSNANGTPGGDLRDIYWITGFKAGRYSGNWTYTLMESELSDSQMRNTGSVTRPSDGVTYSGFIEALNAAVAEMNDSAVYPVELAGWETGAGGYPVPSAEAPSAGVPRKKVSILGDSISTYQGFTPYPSNYQYPKAAYTGFNSVSMTWWHQLIYDKMTNAKLEVNSSYTGTCVQETTDKGHPGYGFLHRYVELGNPDVIIVNGGTNDAWSFSLPVGTLDFSLATDALDEFQFAQAYDKLIRLLKTTYPSADIACVIGDNVMDASKAEYAQVIRDVCTHYDLPYAEVVFADRASLTYDNVHPNIDGMQEMANQVWNALAPSLEPGSNVVPDLDARVVNVDSPRMKVYLPATDGTIHGLVIACPGGGYSSIPGADGYEGAYYKDVVNQAGYALAVLYYTLPGGDSSKPTGDMEAALRLVRRKAGQWYVDPDKIGVMGFSAGGHLASWAATHLSGGAKADFQVLFYPVITMGDGTHAGSRTQFLGPAPTDAQVELFSNENYVSASTPPAFLAYAGNDTTVPPANNGAAYYDALVAAGVAVERHVYADVSKPHGWHWGSFTFDGVAQSDGTKFEYLDQVKDALSCWLVAL
ncbi:MAG: alpha/beta hydrolase fold domain-containing protein [Bacteroidales bacterium]|nr:alpha/beta hydrolase fold domain-containing protein [Bacteroidales bacterium]